MKKALYLFILIVCAAVIVIAKPDGVRRAFAGTGDNVTGFAWSENYGWVSFNSTDCDIDGDGAFEGAGETGGPAPAGCPASGMAVDYGVDIDAASGHFSGQAWSDNIGWISFEETNPPDAYAFNANCNTPGSCTGNCTACLSADNNVYGWAKVLSLGDEGWVSLNSGSMYTCPSTGVNLFSQTACDSACLQTQNCDCPPADAQASYALQLNSVASCPSDPGNNQCDQTSPFLEYGFSEVPAFGAGPAPTNSFVNGTCCGNVSGTRYMFDLYTECVCPVAGGGSCSAPPASECTGPLACVPFVNSFSVSYDSGTNSFIGWAWNGNDNGTGIGWISFNCADTGSCGQSDYKVIANLNSAPTVAPAAPYNSDTELCAQTLKYYLPWDYTDAENDSMDGYQLQVTVGSDWVTPVINEIVDTGGMTVEQFVFDTGISYNTTYNWRVMVKDTWGAWSEWTNGADFTTPVNKYPDPDIGGWTPKNFSSGEEILFTGTSSLCYDPSNNPTNCNKWHWQTNPDTSTISRNDSLLAASTTIIFNIPNQNYIIDLGVTDGNNYTCTTSTSTKPGLGMPRWIETR